MHTGVNGEASGPFPRLHLAGGSERRARVGEIAQHVVALGTKNRAAFLGDDRTQSIQTVVDAADGGGIADLLVERRAAGYVGQQQSDFRFIRRHRARPGFVSGKPSTRRL